MADLFILLPAHDADTALFAWRERGAWVFADELPGARADAAIAVVFVPGPTVTRHRAQVTARKFSDARQAALFAVEDDVAEPVEHLHIALGPAEETGERDVLVASAADMGEWIAWISANGLATADIVVTHSFLPDNADAFEGAGEYLIRSKTGGVSLDADLDADIVRALVPVQQGRVYGESLARIVDTTPAGPGRPLRQAWLEWLAESYEAMDSGSAISLRQGAYAIRRQLNLEGVRRWRVIAALAAAAAVLWLGTVGLETSAYRAQIETLNAEAQRMAGSAVPSSNGNVAAAIESLRSRQRSGGVGLRPTIASAALYEAVGDSANAEIRSLRYDAATGQLTALVLVNSYADADAIGERLEESGLGVSLGQARQTGQRVLGEFVIEGGV